MSNTYWGDSLSVPELIEQLSSNGTMYYRQRAAYLLGQRGDASAVDPLVRAFLTDTSTDVQNVAAGALRLLRADPSPEQLRANPLPDLVRFFHAERRPKPRARLLEMIVQADTVAGGWRPTSVECLIHGLKDSADPVRAAAFRCAQNPAWRQAIMSSLPDAERVLVAAASDASAEVRRAALEGFRQERPDPPRAACLLNALRDEDVYVRRLANQLVQGPASAWCAAVDEQDADAVWLLAEEAPTVLGMLPDRALSAQRWARVGLACCWQTWEQVCSRHTWGLIPFQRTGKPSLADIVRQALEVAERCLEKTATTAELERARQALGESLNLPRERRPVRYWEVDPIVHLGEGVMQSALACLTIPELAPAAEAVRSAISALSEALSTHGKSPLVGIIHDVVGNPRRRVALDPYWRTSTVVDLAHAIDDERAFDRMPILADALMEAGCDSEEIIQHCRSNGPHARGCWVVDLLLGKM